MTGHLAGMAGAALLAVIVIVIGRILTAGALGLGRLRRLGTAEAATAAGVLGLAAVTITNLLLAYLGLFRPLAVLFVPASLAVIGLTALRRRGALRDLVPPIVKRDLPLFVLAAGVCVFAILFRFDMIDGMRDPGVYTASAIELSRTGDFGWRDGNVARSGFAPVQHLFEDLHDLMGGKPRWLRFPGFYLTAPERGAVEPQFLHGYETWLALAYSFGGPQATQCVNALFAALALLAVSCVVTRVLNPTAGACTAIFLAIHPAQMWFARYTGNELMVQALTWGFMLLYVIIIQSSDGPPLPRRAFPIAVLPLCAAALTKMAVWGFLPIVAFDAALRRSRGMVRLPAAHVWGLLPLVAGAALLHARLFAGFYLYGSWQHTGTRLEIPYSFLPLIMVLGTAAAASAGALGRPLFVRFQALATGRKARLIAPAAAAALTALLLHHQRNLLARPEILKNVWEENVNVAQFAMYMSTPVFLVSAAGLLVMLQWPGRRGLGLVALLAGASCLFLVRRNLDSVHPWGARRWIIMLVPAFCAAAAFPAAACLQARRWPVRLAGAAWLLVAGGLVLGAAPHLLTARHYRGAIPAADRLAQRLHRGDLNLFQPTWPVAQWAPYLKARFDIECYVHSPDETAWKATTAIGRGLMERGASTIYVTNTPLTSDTIRMDLAELAGTEVMEYRRVLELAHRLPRECSPVSHTLYLYKLRFDLAPGDWWPFKPMVEKRARAAPPFTLKMDRLAAPYLKGFFNPTPSGPADYFRWTDGLGCIRIGELLQFPLDKRTVRLTARMSSRRPERTEPVEVHWFLDMEDPVKGRRIHISKVAPEPADYAVELDSAELHPESTLFLTSGRHRVGSEVKSGVVGIAVEYLRVEQ